MKKCNFHELYQSAYNVDDTPISYDQIVAIRSSIGEFIKSSGASLNDPVLLKNLYTTILSAKNCTRGQLAFVRFLMLEFTEVKIMFRYGHTNLGHGG